MKLTSVRVNHFRNILDSTQVAIDPKVTCLVGKNESGKTAFLSALWRLRPARTRPEFSVSDHYPAWLEKRHRNEGKDLNTVQPVKAAFELEESDVRFLEEAFGPDVVSTGAEFTLGKTYENAFRWTNPINESAAVKSWISSRQLKGSISKILKGQTSFAHLTERLKEFAKSEDKDEAQEGAALLATLNELKNEDESFDDVCWKLLIQRVPKFFYFAEYSKLPYSVSIKKVLENQKDLGEAEATARSLLILGGVESDQMLDNNYERRKRELENVSNALTDDVLKYWSQNPDLRVQPEITQKTIQQNNGHTAVLDELKIRIWDNRHSLSLPFDEHSAGFQWFFSFLAAFSEYEHANPPVIILLDEPAVGLHAKAQSDFLRFIEERLTKRSQVIYSTHSPFMIQSDRLDRARVVEDKGKEIGTVVSSEVLSTDKDTIFPLQAALGYDLAQNLFVSKHNLVVEGTSDFTYLTIISDSLSESGNKLDSRWTVVPVGGADSIPTFAALLGNHLDLTILVDSRKEGQQKLLRLASQGFLQEKRIISVGEVVGEKLADIEDLFAPDLYLQMYNRAFNSKLKIDDLKGGGPIVSRIARHLGVDRFDHGRVADHFLRNRETYLPKLDDGTLEKFKLLFAKINATMK